MGLIDQILKRQEFINEPPVLVDIGASGEIHKKWKRLVKYSICIAFDADSRDFNSTQTNSRGYKKLILKNSLVSDRNINDVSFYLTKSPYCSSLLKPNIERLSVWSFAPLFKVEKIIKLNATDLSTTLQEFGIKKIDWFKSDSQGTDLRIFKNLDLLIQERIIVAEFEPGIIDAYDGEDKLHHVLSYMDSISKFWLADLIIKGTMRINIAKYQEIFKNPFIQKVVAKIGKPAPGWGEMTFINTFQNSSTLTKRDLLFGWVCCTLQKQHAFAYELASIGKEKLQDPIFDKLMRRSKLKIKLSTITLKYFYLLWKKLFSL